jgi:hypothetical protein
MGILLGGGYLAVGSATGCISYMAETALTAADFSFIFDCDDAVGGTLELGGFLIDCGTNP